MTTSAIIMLVMAIALLWGGLSLSILHLLRNPED